MAKIADISTKLSLNNRDFKKGLQSTSKSLGKFHAAFKNTAGKIAKAGALALAAAGAAMVVIVKKTADEIDKLSKQARKLDITTEMLTGLGHAAKLSGLDQEKLGKSLVKMTKAVSEANQGLSTQKKAFEGLGISIEDLRTMDAGEQFLAIADGLQEVENHSDKVRIAMDIFGKTGGDMLITMEQGAEGIRKAMKEAERLGITFKDEQGAMVEEANDAMMKLGEIAKGAFNQITIALAPFVTKWADSFTEMSVSGESMADRVTAAMRSIVQGMGFLEDKTVKIRGIFKFLAADMLELTSGLKMLWNLPTALLGINDKPPAIELGQAKAMEKLAFLDADRFAAMVQSGKFGQVFSETDIERMAVDILREGAGQDLDGVQGKTIVERFDDAIAKNKQRVKQGAAKRAGKALEKAIGAGGGAWRAGDTAGIGPMTEDQWEVALLRSAEPAIAPAMAAKALKAVKRATKGLEKNIGAGKGIGPMTEAQWETDLLKDLDPRGFSPREAAPEWQQIAQKKWLKMRGLKPLKFAQIGEAAVFKREVESWEVGRLRELDRGLQKFAAPAGSSEELRRRRATGLTRTEERFRMRQQREKLEDQLKARRQRDERRKGKADLVELQKGKVLLEILRSVNTIRDSKFVSFAS